MAGLMIGEARRVSIANRVMGANVGAVRMFTSFSRGASLSKVQARNIS